MARLAAKDLAHEIRADMPGAYAKLAVDFNEALTKLREAMRIVADASAAMRSGGDEIVSASDDMARRTETQAASIEETAAALEQVTATVAKSAGGAKHARDIAAGVREKSRQSNIVVAKAMEAMSRIEKSSGEIGRSAPKCARSRNVRRTPPRTSRA